MSTAVVGHTVRTVGSVKVRRVVRGPQCARPAGFPERSRQRHCGSSAQACSNVAPKVRSGQAAAPDCQWADRGVRAMVLLLLVAFVSMAVVVVASFFSVSNQPLSHAERSQTNLYAVSATK